jgi:histidinol-phosphate aminotransferase
MSKTFLKRSLRDFDPYVPGHQPPDGQGWVKLNTNEAPWPPSPKVLQAVRAAVDESLRLYPSPTWGAAREAIARHHGVGADQVALGNGGDELIAMAFRAFAGAGDRVAHPYPTYSLLEPLGRMHECVLAPHPMTADWELPDSFARDEAPLKFLVNPNSPTGTWLGREAVREVVTRSSGVVVIDEAYVDFAPEHRLDLIREGHENLLVLRTFSKSYALAGMRIGYAIGPVAAVAALNLVKDSYNLDRLAIVAARAAIEDREYHARLVDFVTGERAWLASRLRQRGFEVAPPAANFLFVRPPPGRDAGNVHAGLQGRRVLVRHYEQEPIAGWLRVTVGTREQHETLLDALEEVMA